MYYLGNLTEELAFLAASKGFAQVRHRYLTSYMGAINMADEDSDWCARFRFVNDNDDPVLPGPALILNCWNEWLSAKETNREPNWLGEDRVAYFTTRAQELAAAATHPYDKTGAILAVFKEYRQEVETKLGRRIRIKHNRLRHDMTDFLQSYSQHALFEAGHVVTSKGLGQCIRQAYPVDLENITVLPPVPGALRDVPKGRAFLSLEAPRYSAWTQDKEAIMHHRQTLGAKLKAFPPEALYIFDRYTGDRDRMVDYRYPRKPPESFVIEHYLLTHDEHTWDGSFFIDTLLRKLPDVIRRPLGEYAHYSDDEFLLVTDEYRTTLAQKRSLVPILSDDVFSARWKAIEKAAWKDYRRIRAQALKDYGSCMLERCSEPSLAELRPPLVERPARVFHHPYSKLDLPLQKKLLDRVMPGLGTRYAGLRLAQEALDIPVEDIVEQFQQAVDERLPIEHALPMVDLCHDVSVM